MDELLRFRKKFATVEDCLKHLEAVRWADGAFCPHCGGSDMIYHYSDNRRHKCGECLRVFRVITGTIFGDSPTKMLPKWFAAIWLETCHSKGISSVRLAKEIGVTQKTAWYMLRRIRQMSDRDSADVTGGAVAADKANVAERDRNPFLTRRTSARAAHGDKIETVVARAIDAMVDRMARLARLIEHCFPPRILHPRTQP